MTKTYHIAHIHEQGQDIVIVPLEAYSIDCKTDAEQNAIRDGLQFFASDAGLKGTVCLVWQSGGMFKFRAPTAWHPFFRSINMDVVRTNLNRTLTCTYQDAVSPIPEGAEHSAHSAEELEETKSDSESEEKKT